MRKSPHIETTLYFEILETTLYLETDWYHTVVMTNHSLGGSWQGGGEGRPLGGVYAIDLGTDPTKIVDTAIDVQP